MKTAIIIPARMASKRFPNKPMAKINGIPMIERVWKQGINSKVGDVFVACCEAEVYDLITAKGGIAIMTNPDLPSGTDRVYAAFNKINNKEDYTSIINLQGDMPLIDPSIIERVNIPLSNGYEIGTIATDLNEDEEKNKNITKVIINWKQKNQIGESIDFFKSTQRHNSKIYQHVGIYSFKPIMLRKFVSLEPSINEVDRQLEQFRAIDAGIKIGITYVENVPISVDTLEDLMVIEKIIND